MSDKTHDIQVLVSIAKVDAALHGTRSEMATMPQAVAKVDKAISKVDHTKADAIGALESKQKERRDIERQLQDDEAQNAKYKNQLMEVKTNKEYTAMLKEIETLATHVDKKEERLLVLMDDLEEVSGDHDEVVKKLDDERGELADRKQQLEQRQTELDAEMQRLETEKPAYLREINETLRKRYLRLSGALQGLAVTTVKEGACAGCGRRLPPQLVVEVRQNQQIITCEGCGRILVYYS